MEPMKVTLVNPPYTFWKAGAEPLAALLGLCPPLGPLSLAAYVRQRLPDLTIEILDAPAQGLTRDETARRVIDGAPDLVGITMTTAVVPNAEAIALAVKAARPEATVVVGGPHVSGAGTAALPASNAFDLAVVGEGEETFCEILEALGGRGSGRAVAANLARPSGSLALPSIKGILYRDAHGEVQRTAPRHRITDLDSLPIPAFDLLADFPRAYPSNIFFSPRGPAASLVTSRGCPFHCTFCDQSTFGHDYRAASAESVFAHVKKLQEDYGVRYLVFYDDTFTLDRPRVLRLCELLSGLRPRLAWTCDANVMTVDPALLEAMKRAGCWSISYGLESGSARVLASLGKASDLHRAREAVRATRAAGIRVKGLFFLGTPEESTETIRETRAFIRSLPLTTMNLSKFTPYPGSALHSQVKETLVADSERLNGMNFVVPSRHLSVEELQREYDLTIRDFYWRPGVFANHLAMLLGHWHKIRRLLAAAPSLMRARRQPRTSPAVFLKEARRESDHRLHRFHR
jgi:radical SAM superfamily enzyme YgiQ (UPF0313 family)